MTTELVSEVLNRRRFSALERLYGVSGAEAVFAAHVAVVGVGGVGSWAAEALARSGVGAITLIDMDHISESNINRQVHALESTIGMAKVEAMRQRIIQINPRCRVHSLDLFVEPEHWPSILSGEVDAVIDACDQVKAKLAMAHWARTSKTLFLTVGAAGGKRLAHAVDVADLSQVTHDPLLAQVRYQLRKKHNAPRDGKQMKVQCVYSKEAVVQPDASCGVQTDSTLNCHGYGSAVSVTATFGLCAAGWILNRISERASISVKNSDII